MLARKTGVIFALSATTILCSVPAPAADSKATAPTATAKASAPTATAKASAPTATAKASAPTATAKASASSTAAPAATTAASATTAAPSATTNAAPAATTAAPAADARSPAATAKALYDEGVDLTGQKSFKEAEAKFLQAWALQKSYDIAANLGEVQMQLEKPAEAAVYLTYALSNYPASGKADKREWIEKRLAEARSKVASLTITVSVAGADVRVNGKSAGKAPLEGEVFAAPGDITIEVIAAGYQPFAKKTKVAAGRSQKVEISPAPAQQQSHMPLGPIISGIGGVAALITGVGLYVTSSSDYNDAKKLADGIKSSGKTCGGASPPEDCAKLKSKAESSDSLYTPALGLMIGGAAITVVSAGFITYYATRSSAPAKTGSGPRVTAVGVRGTGLVLQGSF